MAAARYRFHCTDGHDAVLDRGGRLVPGEYRLRAYAVQAACAVMACDAGLDWSDWIVDMHDARGRRYLMLGFSEIATVCRGG